jgi:hypothetical protein
MTADNNIGRKDFECIFSSNRPLEIEAAKALLADSGIESYTINKSDSSYIFGETELYVQTTDVLKAQAILVKNDLL